MSTLPPPPRPLGSCTLVGAGPGDPELLTLKALKAIQAATLLLVDDLVSDVIVAYAAPTARVVYVGKRGGCRSTPQAFNKNPRPKGRGIQNNPSCGSECNC